MITERIHVWGAAIGGIGGTVRLLPLGIIGLSAGPHADR